MPGRMTLQQQLESGLSHHQAGRLAEAERIYRSVLAQQPNHAGALNLLGVLASQAGKSDAAVELLRRAIAICSTNALYYSNLGKVLGDIGRLGESVDAYRQAIGLKPDLAEAHSNLGNALTQLGQLDEALASCRRAIQLKPDFAEAHNNLGNVLKDVGQLDETIASYRQAVRLKPDLAEAHNTLANALNAKGQIDEAIACYRQAVRLKPNDARVHCNLGTALYEKGRLDEAIAAQRRAIRLKADYAEAYNSLAHALQRAGRVEEAAAAYRQAISLRPDTPEWQFELAALLGDRSVKTAPTQFVRKLFDEYAAKFDKHLVEKLKYQAPQLLLRAVRQATPRRDLDVLDLGCGTGLCGQEFRPYARRLVGVDLSPAMIRAAETRGIYDQLITGELLPALREAPGSYDLIAAGDVLIYVGDLTDFMPAVAGALRSGGLFACSIEEYDGQGFFLHAEERFAHSIGYVRQMARESGLSEISAEKAAIRCNAGAEVPGWIVILGKLT